MTDSVNSDAGVSLKPPVDWSGSTADELNALTDGPDFGTQYTRELFTTTDRMPITKAGRDPNGFFRVTGLVTAPGVYRYIRDGKPRMELKPAEELYSVAHMKSIQGAIVTDEHPENGEAVTPSNAGELQMGQSSSLPEVTTDGMLVDLVITRDTLIAGIESKRKRGISLGMRNWFDHTPGVWTAPDGSKHPYDVVQRGMFTNHIAILGDAPRVPTAKLLLDSTKQDKQGTNMSETTTIKVDGVVLSLDSRDAGVIQAAMGRHDESIADWKAKWDTAKTSYDSLEKERDSLIAQRDTMEAERDAAKKKLDSHDSVDHNALVIERIAFMDKARTVLTPDQFKSVQSKTVEEIRQFTCDAHDIDCLDSVTGKPKGPAYVEAWFDSIIKDKAKGNDDQLIGLTINQPVTSADGAEYKEMNERLAESRAPKRRAS